MRKIKVIIKAPGMVPKEMEIENTLEAMQKIVGGYIEAVTICEDLAIICNEDGRWKNLPWNCEICGIDFVGTIFFAGVAGDEFTDAPSMEQLTRLMPGLWGQR